MANTESVQVQTEAKPDVKTATPKKKRHRSPAYPAIHLEEAIERAKQMYQAERKNAAPLDVVVAHWGYKAKSSSGLLAAAAMKKFGLLVEVAGASTRQLRLSDLALRIILDERPESSERVSSLKEAAMAPAIHQELWKKWGMDLPSDLSIRTYLRMDRNFTDQAADQCIEVYRHTISFASLVAGDTIPNNVQNEDDEDDGTDEELAGGNQQGSGVTVTQNAPAAKVQNNLPPLVKVVPAPPGQKDFPLYLSNNQKAILYIPATMTAKDYKLLKQQIENHLAVIEATSVEDGNGGKPN